jgi:5-methylcytosine-specific restriction enzyme A
MVKMLKPRVGLLDVRSAKPPAKEREAFYISRAYVQWREAVIAHAGGRCQWPGCGTNAGRLYADHVIERRDGGADLDPSNGQCLCHRHHTLKTNQAARARAGGGLIPRKPPP